ncbi:HAD family hydrolase [Bacillus anthracis]|nr:HAD family hydrolase [Bacillus anthracis]
MKYVVFDLDETIFNHTDGEIESLKVIYHTDFKTLGVTFDDFYGMFVKFNKIVWKDFEKGIQGIEETLFNRFKLLCEFYGIEKDLANLTLRYSHEYVKKCAPYKGVHKLLQELKNMGLSLAVCSNGMEEIQMGKMAYHNVKEFFSYFQFGSKCPFCKPHLQFFDALLEQLNVQPYEILFVGDSLLNDITPAENLGMRSLHINDKYLIGGELQCSLILKQIQNMAVLS